MARTKRSRRSYGAGEWGRNRVRVFPDPKTGLYQIEWRENGRRLTRSLKHRDWARAKRQADEAAAGFAVHEPNGKAEAEPEPLTLGRLFEIYGEEVTPTRGEHTQRRDRVAAAMFLRFFGRDRRPETLSQRDRDRFRRERRAGRVGPSGKPVGNRMIEWDLTFLMAVLNWAARSRDEQGRMLLDRNPLKGLRKPVEKNPTAIHDAMLLILSGSENFRSMTSSQPWRVMARRITAGACSRPTSAPMSRWFRHPVMPLGQRETNRGQRPSSSCGPWKRKGLEDEENGFTGWKKCRSPRGPVEPGPRRNATMRRLPSPHRLSLDSTPWAGSRWWTT